MGAKGHGFVQGRGKSQGWISKSLKGVFRLRGGESQDKGNGFPVPEGRVRWDIGEEFFPERVGRPWNGSLRESEAALSLEVPKALLDAAWSTLGWWKVTLSRAGNELSFKILPNPIIP